MALAKRITDDQPSLAARLKADVDAARQHLIRANQDFEAGAAILLEIRDSRRYQLTHGSWEAFVKAEFGHTGSWANRLIQALGSGAASEREARALRSSHAQGASTPNMHLGFSKSQQAEKPSSSPKVPLPARESSYRAPSQAAPSGDVNQDVDDWTSSQDVDPDARPYVPADAPSTDVDPHLDALGAALAQVPNEERLKVVDDWIEQILAIARSA